MNEEIDDIELMIDNMERQSHSMEYEEAQYILDKIKEELFRKEDDSKFIRIFHVETIKDIYNLVTSNSIRLNVDDYQFSKFLDLLINLKKRKSELQGGRYIDTDRQRKIVAEEMANIEMIIPTKFKGKKPNRSFLDIAFKVNPSLCKNELMRREKVMMWKAVEKGKDSDKEKVREKLRKYKEE